MAHSSSIRVEINTKSDALTPYASRENPELGEINGRHLDQSYIALLQPLSLIHHVGSGISSNALSNHTVTISVLIEAVTFFNSLCASHSVS
jgi:hypothetical protein